MRPVELLLAAVLALVVGFAVTAGVIYFLGPSQPSVRLPNE